MRRRVARPLGREQRVARAAEQLHGLAGRAAPEADQAIPVTPRERGQPVVDSSAPSSYQEYAYEGSSRSRARVVSFNGRNVSHITASSSVRVEPSDFSTRPG